ncbi:hypothetical protein G5B47_22995 [Paenibacillus sp. 7124]|uniref:DUF3153 domain-containing protein n=1 Tax=Paenibacillus apii TaxID=1850370 RepID=A0A6M1PS97_9BACL|nr:hypothetical protein [Paenibacillus apii]NGM85274.1 hypothetical protein [Paenibacillus apii]NJJ41853.1 hypothetical protein [Paenibacillus apii]
MKSKLSGMILILMFILSGCAKGTGHLSIHKDGSLDLNLSVRLNQRAQMFLNPEIEGEVSSKAEAAGFTFKTNQTGEETEYQLHKHFDTLEEMGSSLNADNEKTFEADITETFFYTKYKVSGQINMPNYETLLLQKTDNNSLPEPLMKLILQKASFDFKLTLPASTIGKHNAMGASGTTLTWDVSLEEPTPIRFEFYAPHMKNIVIAGLGLIIIVTLIVFILLNNKKKKGDTHKNGIGR